MVILIIFIFIYFYRKITGNNPYFWQIRLAIIPFNEWPLTAELPTSSGKTDITLIWLFKLLFLKEENIPIRIAIIVNRRSLVSQCYEIYNEYIKKIKKEFGIDFDIIKLCGADGSFNDKREFIYKNRSIIIGTLDLLGSSILFNSYLFSDRSKLIAGGFFLRNTFFLLDEVQINPNFFKILRQIDNPSKNRKVLAISATLPYIFGDTFRLDNNDYNYPQLGKKLNVNKRLILSEAKNEEDFIKKIVKCAKSIEDKRPILITLNKPSVARKISECLGGSKLFTGRMRNFEKKKLEDEIIKGEIKCKYLITTQVAELGIDFKDISNHLIIESCDLSSCLQRAGRPGRHSDEDVYIYLFLNKEEINNNKIYGKSYEETYKFLKKNNITNFSLSNVDRLLSSLDNEKRNILFNLDNKYSDYIPSLDDLIMGRNKIPIQELLYPNHKEIYVYIAWRDFSKIDDEESYLKNNPIRNEETCRVLIYELKDFLKDKKFYYRCFNEYIEGDISDIFPGGEVVIDCKYGGLKGGNFDSNCKDKVYEIKSKKKIKINKKSNKNYKIRSEKLRHEVKSTLYLPEGTPLYAALLIIKHHGRGIPSQYLLEKAKDEIKNLPDYIDFDGIRYSKRDVSIFKEVDKFESECNVQDLAYYCSILRIADWKASHNVKYQTLEEHTKLVIEEVDKICDIENLTNYERCILKTSAVIHDFGKISPEFQLKIRGTKIFNEDRQIRKIKKEMDYRKEIIDGKDIKIISINSNAVIIAKRK